MPDLAWKKLQLSSNVFEISFNLRKNKDFEAWALLTSDRHWDNPHSNQELQIKHLELAKKRGAVVLDAGDLFCCMQGKYDKRASKAALRPEHQVDNYFDSLVETASDFFAPYAKHIAFIGMGNHEDSVNQKHEINLTERLVSLLTHKGKSQVFNGTFSGFVFFRFDFGDHNNGNKRSHNKITLHYDHGYGGGGPVTHDAIQHQRRSVYLPDADIIISGHTHDKWIKEIARKRVSNKGVIYHDIQTHIKLATYKDDYGKGDRGWHALRGMPPKPVGAWWIRFFYDWKLDKVIYEAISAS